MLRIIKRSLKYFIIIAGILILLPTILYLALQLPSVQTLIVKRITSHLSAELKSTFSVGRIEYKFFNKLSIYDVIIKDKNNDTLIYSEKISASFKRIDIKNKNIKVGGVILVNPVIAIITDSTGSMNLNWYLDLLKNPADTIKKGKTNFSIDQIDISNGSFSLINRTAAAGKTKMDFNNLRLSGIYGIIEDLKIKNDTTTFDIFSLSLNETSGFSIDRMRSTIMLAKNNISLSSMTLHCDSSILNVSKFSLISDSSSSFKRFTGEVKLDILLDKSLINSTDLEYFIPGMAGINESIWLSGKIAGTISELRGRNIVLSYRDYTSLDCDFDFSGLPRIENAFIYIGVNSLKTNAKDLEKIKLPGKGYIVVPEVLYKLGDISFDGSFTGFTTDFVTYGMIRTSQGNIRTDISLRPEESNKYKIKGLLTGSDINLGELTGKTELLGKLTMRTNVDGYAYSLKKFAADLTGKIDSVEINRYKYRDISINGFFTEKTWDGSINIKDRNIKLDLLGMFNFRDTLPEFNFTLNLSEANLFELNLDKLDTTSSLSMLLTSNFKGDNIDNLDGEIKILNSTFIKHGKSLELYDLTVTTYKENSSPVLSLRTDFVDADIRGYYNFATFGNLIRSKLSALMPSQFTSSVKRNGSKKNNFTFEVNFKNTDKINEFFRTGILLADKSSLRGSVYTDSTINISGKSGSLSIKNNILKDLNLEARITGSELYVDIKSSGLFLLGQSDLKGFSVGLVTKPDNFVFNVNWDNKDKILNRGNFIARGSIAKNAPENGRTILKIDIDSTNIIARNNPWKINPTSILIDTSSVKINKLYIGNNDHYYIINGSISHNLSDTMHLEFKGIDISPLNYIGSQKSTADPNKISLDFKGTLNGKIMVTNVYKNILVESNIDLRDFSLLGARYGDITISSALDNARKIVNINASNNLAGVKMFDMKGYYDPAKKKIDITAKANKLPLEALNPLLKIFASGITGFASGEVNLSGQTNKLVLKGAVLAENTSMKIDYLQTRFKLNDTIRFDKNGIRFNSVKLADERGNIAILSGAVNHKNFKDYSADLVVNIIRPNECLVLNTKPKDNELFYGTAYVSGLTTIKSGPNSLSFDISARTGNGTKFFIPLSSGLSVSEYSFITFIDSSTVRGIRQGILDEKTSLAPPVAKKMGMDLNFDLDVTPDAEVQIIFDSKIGDVMKGRGSGNLNINLNKKGDFKMSGVYIIEDGDYLFTLKNILNKSFSVENGGRITFNGDLRDAEIDIRAIYRLKTSLMPIIQDEAFSERIDVQCQLNLSGKLFNPVVSFNIELPNADEQTKAYLRNAISTEEELSRQFLYLLVMNSFYADAGSASGSTGATGTSAMAVTTTEMLSNQLSNWLSQINNDFDIGLNWRPGTKDINSQEVQLALSTQLLNNKVVINGNFDYRGIGGATENANQITGDFDAEVRLTEKIRLKVFNRFNNTYSGKGPYTQGVGIFFKEDFNKFSDLFGKKVKAEMKKEEETSVKKE